MGELRGIDVVPKLVQKLVTEEYFVRSPIVVVDVGARKGFEPQWQYFKNQINQIGFEPEPSSFSECATLKSTPNGKYYPYALDSGPGLRKLFVTKYLSATSFLRPNMKMIKRLGLEGHFQVIRELEVETVDLDSFCIKNGIDYVDFFKIDAEGFELEILRGAEKYLTNHILGVSVEIAFYEYRNGQATLSQIDQYLSELGFTLFDLDLNRIPVVGNTSHDDRKKHRGRLTVGQALYVRDLYKEMDKINSSLSMLPVEKIMKLISFYEIYGLVDCAAELIFKAGRQGYLTETQVKEYSRLVLSSIQTTKEKILKSVKNVVSRKFRLLLKSMY